MNSLTKMMQGPVPVCAPLVLDPMMAKMAEKAGFKALYLGGGAIGYQRVYLEANLTLTEMAQAALEVRTVCDLPLIFDAAAGWGDAMHMHRTMGMAEAAGFAAIEIEDQLQAGSLERRGAVREVKAVCACSGRGRDRSRVKESDGQAVRLGSEGREGRDGEVEHRGEGAPGAGAGGRSADGRAGDKNRGDAGACGRGQRPRAV